MLGQGKTDEVAKRAWVGGDEGKTKILGKCQFIMSNKLVKLLFNIAYASECKFSNDVILYLITNNLLTIQNQLRAQ